MKRLLYIILGAVALTSVTACKPTERGYKDAYDAAKRKRAEAAAEAMLPATGLQSVDGPQLRVIDGDSIYVSREQLRLPDGRRPAHSWYVAVGVYKMSTNAQANAKSLAGQGYKDAVALRASDSRWMTMAYGAGSLDSVRVAARMFKAEHPDYPFVGLPGCPVLVSAY